MKTYPPELAYVFGKLAIAMNNRGQKIYKSDQRFIVTSLRNTEVARYRDVVAQLSRIE